MKYATQEPGRALTKKLLALVLTRVKAYSPHLKWMKPITMTGQYLTVEGYKELQKKGEKQPKKHGKKGRKVDDEQ